MADLIDRDAVAYRVKSCITIPADNEWDSGYNTAMAEAEQYIQNAPAVNLWIPCSERLPEKSGEYLVYTEYEDVFKCYFEKENDPEEDECQWGFYQDYRDPDTLGWAGTTWTAVETVTHWMTLPEPPKEDET